MNSLTPNQARDRILDNDTLTTSIVVKVLALQRLCDSARRSDLETYVRCPRCYGYHSVYGNFDNLCDSCVTTLLTQYPEHEASRAIRAC